jgi:DNA-binding NarL/FixJ family response regulator
MRKSIIIADDHSMFAESLAENLVRNGNYEVLKIVKNGVELLEQLNFHSPDIILLDYNMPEMDGLQAAREILKKTPRSKILLITMHSSLHILNPMIKMGIKGIVLKNTSTAELVVAIQDILNGKTYYSQEIISNLAKGMQNKIEFTRREFDIIHLLKDGLNTKEIADTLSISTHTVDSHRKSILYKTDTKNTQAMIKRLEDEGIL